MSATPDATQWEESGITSAYAKVALQATQEGLHGSPGEGTLARVHQSVNDSLFSVVVTSMQVPMWHWCTRDKRHQLSHCCCTSISLHHCLIVNLSPGKTPDVLKKKSVMFTVVQPLDTISTCMRAILDIRALNHHLRKCKFQIWTHASVL